MASARWRPSQVRCYRVPNEHFKGEGVIIYKHACKLSCEGIVSTRLGSRHRSGRLDRWFKVKNPGRRPTAKLAAHRKSLESVRNGADHAIVRGGLTQNGRRFWFDVERLGRHHDS
jgi:ATP-dependent DNA ligase